ncbi:MAG: hypothetical protein K6U14_11935 [Firmicutes bacterium]|nr:hypothetical protein [Alicyclobacillaceae bacterium]MCL6498323.1 hypothetical protein [Bacillota bacterium]
MRNARWPLALGAGAAGRLGAGQWWPHHPATAGLACIFTTAFALGFVARMQGSGPARLCGLLASMRAAALALAVAMGWPVQPAVWSDWAAAWAAYMAVTIAWKARLMASLP